MTKQKYKQTNKEKRTSDMSSYNTKNNSEKHLADLKYSISKIGQKINKRNISVLISRPLSNVKYKMEKAVNL